MSVSLLILGRAETESLLDFDDVIESQRRAFVALSEGTGQLAPRQLLDGADGSTAFCYAARLSPDTGPVSKFGSVNLGNAAMGLPSVHALVLVLDPHTGEPRALIDGEAITTARTPAATAVAAEALGRTDARTLTVLGCGVQGQAHARVLAHALPITRVRLWSRTAASRQAAARALAGVLDVDLEQEEDVQKAVAESDFVVTATTSTAPLFDGDWLSPGTTVLSVGSFGSDRHEVGQELLRSAHCLVVDDVETALVQAGPIVEAIRSGVISRDDIAALGDVLTGRALGRTNDEQIVFYNSVGLGIQDAATASLLLSRAAERGVGTPVQL